MLIAGGDTAWKKKLIMTEPCPARGRRSVEDMIKIVFLCRRYKTIVSYLRHEMSISGDFSYRPLVPMALVRVVANLTPGNVVLIFKPDSYWVKHYLGERRSGAEVNGVMVGT